MKSGASTQCSSHWLATGTPDSGSRNSRSQGGDLHITDKRPEAQRNKTSWEDPAGQGPRPDPHCPAGTGRPPVPLHPASSCGWRCEVVLDRPLGQILCFSSQKHLLIQPTAETGRRPCIRDSLFTGELSLLFSAETRNSALGEIRIIFPFSRLDSESLGV